MSSFKNLKRATNWQPIPLDHLLSSYSVGSLRVLLPIASWIILIGGSLITTAQLLPREWITLTGGGSEIINFFLLNPPLILGLLLLFWFGFDWGFIPVYLCSFIIAYYSRMPWEWALVFGISFILGLAIYALAYQSITISYQLRSLRSIAFFIAISFIAAIASSLGSFIWSFSHQLSAQDTLIIWKSWWSGIFFQSILIVGPMLYLFSPVIERLKAKYYSISPREEVSINWIYGSVISVTLTLALFIYSGRMLGKMRVREVAGNNDMAALADILGALESFEIISWTSIGLIILTGYGAIYLLGGWNKQLRNQVDKRTEELEESQRQLKNSIAEKEILLKEVHHRVKNNLALVHGLLELQETTDSERDSSELLQVSRARIRSMALAHEALYKNSDFSSISLKSYIQKIIQTTHESFLKHDKQIELEYKLVDTKLGMSKAIPLGLMVNEIMVNAHKHAFTNRSEGRIEVRNAVTTQSVKLIISDDGVGLPADVNPENSDSLGMLLIGKFAQQLSGELEMKSNGTGTKYALTFPIQEE